MEAAEWADSHCHLDELADPAAAVVEAVACRVTRICAVAEFSTPERWAGVVALARAHPSVVVAGLGVHPCPDGDPLLFASIDPAATAERLRSAAAAAPSHVRVIGEIGLDLKHASTPELAAAQRRVFDAQLAVAAALRLPISVHSRRAARQALEACTLWHRETGLGAALHWYTHSAKLMRNAAAAGLFVSVGPAGALYEPDEKETVAKAGLECMRSGRLLLETDAPVPFGGIPSAPSWIPRVGAGVAALIGVPVSEVASATSSAFARFLQSC